MLVFFPEVSELVGLVASQILTAACLPSIFWDICHYLKAHLIILIHVPRLFNDLSTYIRDKQTGH